MFLKSKNTKLNTVKNSGLAVLLFILTCQTANASALQCSVTSKISSAKKFSKELVRKGQVSLKIQEEDFLLKCTRSPATKKVACDKYKINHVEFINNSKDGVEEAKGSKIKKFYNFEAQLDVQVFFPEMTFIENNGKGVISFGKCKK